MFRMTPQLADMLNSEINDTKLKEEAERQEMITMKQDGISKVLQGLISFDQLPDIFYL